MSVLVGLPHGDLDGRGVLSEVWMGTLRTIVNVIGWRGARHLERTGAKLRDEETEAGV